MLDPHSLLKTLLSVILSGRFEVLTAGTVTITGLLGVKYRVANSYLSLEGRW
jgi:hypothetical protein